MLAAGIFWVPSMDVAAVVGEERDELEREELRELLLGHTIGAEEEGRHGGLAAVPWEKESVGRKRRLLVAAENFEGWE
jgi:hypothetical protein